MSANRRNGAVMELSDKVTALEIRHSFISPDEKVIETTAGIMNGYPIGII